MYSFNVAVVDFTGLPSAIAALDGKHYNSLRARLHSLANKVNTRPTVAGFSVSLRTFAILAFWGKMPSSVDQFFYFSVSFLLFLKNV